MREKNKFIKRVVSLSAAALCMLTSLKAAPTTQLTADAADYMTAFEITENMKIGWNLGNTLDSHGGFATGLATETSWGNPKTTKAMIDAVKAKGFNTVRIPTTWYNHLDGDNNVDPQWMARVKEVVDYGISNDMYVILNLHHEDWIDRGDLGTAYDQMKPRFIKLWTQIADTFKDYDQHLIFEAMNEPRAKGTSHEWWGPQQNEVDTINKLDADFVQLIRSSSSENNKNRLLMVPGYCASADSTIYTRISVPNDQLVAVSIHAYVPYDFTMNTAVGDHSTFTDQYKSSLLGTLNGLKSTFIDRGVPVVIGEMGTSNFNNTEARVQWTDTYITRAKEIGIPCVLWDNNVVSSSQSAGECHGYLDRSSCTWYSVSEPVVNKMMEVINNDSILWAGKPKTTTTSTTSTSTTSTSTTSTTTTTAVTPITTTVTQQTVTPLPTGSGMTVSGQQILDANGNPFVMRGINVAHAWYKNNTEQSIKAAAAKGTNTIRVVCADGAKWDKTSAAELEQIIGWCRENKQICILEAHDATGSDNIADIVKAAEYWCEMKDILNKNKDVVILNIANEWYGQWNSGTWAEGAKSAIKTARDGGIENMIMIDSAGWGQYPKSIGEKGAEVFASDPLKNTVFSAHLYEYAGGNAQQVKENLDSALSCGAPVIVGEFGYKHTDGDVDEAAIMSYCAEKNMGYLAWSWKGNSGGVEYLDLSNDWDGNSLTEWGQIFFGEIAGKASPATNYSGSQPVEKPVYGDTNCDGTVELADAILIMQALANPDKYGTSGTDSNHLTEKGRTNGDCDTSVKGLTSNDALTIQLFLLHSISSLPTSL